METVLQLSIFGLIFTLTLSIVSAIPILASSFRSKQGVPLLDLEPVD